MTCGNNSRQPHDIWLEKIALLLQMFLGPNAGGSGEGGAEGGEPSEERPYVFSGLSKSDKSISSDHIEIHIFAIFENSY